MRRTLPFVVIGLSLVGCAGTSTVTPARAPLAPDVAMGDDVCPMTVPDATVEVQQIDDGTSLVFRTPGDVAELRRRVRTLARLHSFRVGERRDPLLATTDDIANGVRLNIRPIDSSRAPFVHSANIAHAAVLTRGSCPTIAPGNVVAWLVEDDRADRTITSR